MQRPWEGYMVGITKRIQKVVARGVSEWHPGKQWNNVISKDGWSTVSNAIVRGWWKKGLKSALGSRKREIGTNWRSMWPWEILFVWTFVWRRGSFQHVLHDRNYAVERWNIDDAIERITEVRSLSRKKGWTLLHHWRGLLSAHKVNWLCWEGGQSM